MTLRVDSVRHVSAHPWNDVAGEICGEVPVVQMVKEVGALGPVQQIVHWLLSALALPQKLVKPCVTRGRTDAKPDESEIGDERMHWNDEEDRGSGKEDHVLDRVHRDARPRSKVEVAMMYAVRELVEWLPMDQAMSEVEVRLLPRTVRKTQSRSLARDAYSALP
jgi:hypothetical protein